MRNRNTAKESARRAPEMARTERVGAAGGKKEEQGFLPVPAGLKPRWGLRVTAPATSAPATATAPVTAPATAQERLPRFVRARRRVSP